MKSLAKNSLFNMGYQLLNLIFPLIASMYVARILLPAGVGRVSYAQNIASYFVTLAAMGIPTHGLRSISASRNDSEENNKVFSELFVINAITTSVSLVLYFALIIVTPQFSNDIPLYICVGLVIVFNYINIDWLYQGREDYVYIVCRNTVIKVLSLGALFIFVHSQEDYIQYALITSLASCGNYFLSIIHCKRKVKFTIKGLQLKRHVKPILMLSIAYLFGTVYSKIDTTMLGVMSTQEAVGHYSYAHKILAVIVGLCSAMSSAFLPRLSYFFQQDKAEFRHLINKGIQVLTFMTFPMMIGVYILSPNAIVLMYGDEFILAATTLRFFVPLIAILPFGNLLCYQVLIATGKEKVLMPVCGIAAIINIVLNSILIPRYAQDGAAIASVITELFICSIELCYVMKNVRVRINMKSLITTFCCSMIMGLIVFFSVNAVAGIWMKIVIGVFTGVISYLSICLLTRNPVLMYLKYKTLLFFKGNKNS